MKKLKCRLSLSFFVSWLVSLCLVSSSSFVFASNFHAFLVGDTAPPDICFSVDKDLKAMERHVANIVKYTDQTLKLYYISGENAFSQNVLKALDALVVNDKDDVIFFFFSGHGFRTPSKEDNPWPNLYFLEDQAGIDLFEIGQKIMQKQAKLAIVLADCCNSSLPDYLAPPIAKIRFLPPALNDSLIRANFRKLFRDATGLVMIAASKAGQPSWALTTGGSLFTDAYTELFNTFVKNASTSVLDWQLIVDQITYKTEQLSYKYGVAQTPIGVVIPFKKIEE